MSDANGAGAMSGEVRCIVLGRRRSGASVAYRLLAGFAAGRAVGSAPFAWDEALGDVSRHVHAGQDELAGAALRAHFADGVFFHYNYDAESGRFNEVLLAALAASGYRVVRVSRHDRAARIFSGLVCARLGCADATGVARWRERLRAGEAPPAIDAGSVRAAVADDLAYEQWFEREYARHGLVTLALEDRALLHCGVDGLAAVDRLFEFAGLGDRAARLDDAAALRLLLQGGHYTEGLCQYAPALADVFDQVRAALDDVQR